jgi:hypothetical protein
MKSLLKLSLTAFCLLLSIRVLVAQEPGTSAGSGSLVPEIIGVLVALLVIVATWKVFKGRPAWLGQHHPHLQSLHLVQDRRPAMVVDSVDAHSFG